MKDKSLCVLKENGINVPDFIVIEHGDSKESIREKISTLPEELYAVRSSCNLEDGSQDSFAGQFDTYLNISKSELEERIEMCRSSAEKDSVKSYLEQRGIAREKLLMNVIVQKMVRSEYSGILFTANPQGIINETVIVVGEGLGENVVSDRADTTAYYYNTTDDKYFYDGEKSFLSDENVRELIEISKKIQNMFGGYADIEFALEKGKIYILQARKITTINDEKLLVLDNSNIVESYPGICTPLTASFVEVIYSGVFKGVAKRVLKNNRIIEKYDPVFYNMVGCCNGRMYYKISNWYTVLKFMPFNKKIIPVWQDMLGVKVKAYDEKKNILPLPVRISTYFNTVYELLTVEKHMDELNEEFEKINKLFYEKFNDNISPEEIIGLYDDIKQRLLSVWDITLLNDMYSFIFTGLLKKKVSNDAEANKYISGITNIESMKPIRSLINLAYKFRSESTAKKSPEFEKEFQKHIELYGDRTLEELKLETKTFRTNPELLDERIIQYQADGEKLKSLYEDINKADNAEEKSGFLARQVVKSIGNREKSRINRTRIFGMVRAMFLQFGKHYCEQGYIDKVEDIFYLTIDEIFNCEKHKINYKKSIEQRRNSYKKYEKLPDFSRLIFTGEIVNKNNGRINSQAFEADSEKLSGIPCSYGKVKGEVVVIDDVNNIKEDLKDKILVTKMTDPGWVFLLATAKGIIAEKGSLLSHTAIISRELKLPSIVGVKDVTSILKTGDTVIMNGDTGEIETVSE